MDRYYFCGVDKSMDPSTKGSTDLSAKGHGKTLKRENFPKIASLLMIREDYCFLEDQWSWVLGSHAGTHWPEEASYKGAVERNRPTKSQMKELQTGVGYPGC